MKKVLAIAGLSLASLSFGLDEYLSIPQGKIELDAGYGFLSLTGIYDGDGDKVDAPGSPVNHLFPLQVKYGIIDGLDVELASSGVIGNKDAGEPGGFTQPNLALKYTHAPMGVGGFVNLVLPFVTGNLDQAGEPAMGLGFGAVYGNRFGDFRMTGLAGYQINFENDDKIKSGNSLFIYAKPEAMWTEFIGTYLGLQYTLAGESEFNGDAISGSDGYLLAILPGANVQLLPWLAYEVNVPVTLMGKNSNSAWGINANVYVTLPK